MIVKKPYAFLIKHFKLIHAVLLPFMIYLIYKTSLLFGFFNSYANSGTFSYANDIETAYINVLMYLSIIVILIIVAIVTWLFIIKKKTYKLYIGIIVYYVLLFIGLTIVYNFISGIGENSIDISTIRIYRDIILMFYVPQYILVIFVGIRALGFNIRKFDFSKDLKELEISEKDSEEIELQFKKDNYLAKRKFNRYLREFKYYFFENKFMITMLATIVLLIVSAVVFYNYILFHKSYKEQQTVVNSSFSLVAKKSIVTNLDYQGNIILKDKYYLAVSLDIKNLIGTTRKIDKNNFALEFDDHTIYPIYDRGDYFVDLGIPYKGEKVKGYSNDTYVVVYEIPKKYLESDFRIAIISTIEKEKDNVVVRKKYIKLKPSVVIAKAKVSEHSLNKEYKIDNSMLNDLNVNIKSIEFVGNYYNDKDKGIYTAIDTKKYGFNKTIIKITSDISYSDNNYYGKKLTKNKFITNHFTASYVYAGITYYSNVIDITPKGISDYNLLMVDDTAGHSSDTKLIINLRNKAYYYSVK